MLKLEFIDRSQTSFWIVDDAISIGSSSKNQLVIPRGSILPVHAHIVSHGSQITIEAATPEAQISINNTPIIARSFIRISDVISLAGVELRLIDPSVRQKPTLTAFTTSETEVAEGAATADSSHEKQTWQIKAVVGVHKDKSIEILDTISVGRDASNDIVINGGHISRRHAELFIQNNQLLVRDLDSSNGTSVNGEKIKERAAYLGDEIAFDSVAFHVVEGKVSPGSDSTSVDKTQFRAAITLSDDLSHTAPVMGAVQSHTNTPPIDETIDDGVSYAAMSAIQTKQMSHNASVDGALVDAVQHNLQKNNQLLIFAGMMFLVLLIALGVVFL